MQRLQTVDRVPIHELARQTRGLDQHDTLEALPGLGCFQNGQKWTDARAGGEQPEMTAAGDLAQDQKTAGVRGDKDRVSRVQGSQSPAQRAIRNDGKAEFEGMFTGRIDQGIGPADCFGIDLQTEFDELAGLERCDPGIDLQRNEPLRPDSLANDAALHPLLHDIPFRSPSHDPFRFNLRATMLALSG